ELHLDMRKVHVFEPGGTGRNLAAPGESRSHASGESACPLKWGSGQAAGARHRLLPGRGLFAADR
ncbi:unnamed protein product, partial [marine sediment metagenome]